MKFRALVEKYPRQIIGVLLVVIVAATINLWWAYQVSPKEVAEDSPDTVMTNETQITSGHFFDDVQNFDIALEVRSVVDNVEQDVVDYQKRLTNESLRSYYASDVEFETGLTVQDLYDDQRFPVLAPLYVYMEQDIESVITELTKQHVSSVRPPIQRSDMVKPVLVTESYSFPPREVTKAFVAAELLAIKYPDQVEVYRAVAEQFSLDTIRHGHHLASDVLVAQSVASQYIEMFTRSSVYPQWVEKIE